MNATPTAKVAAAGVSGALSIIIVWAVGLAGVDMPPEVAAAIAVVLSVGAGYIKTERTRDKGDHVA